MPSIKPFQLKHPVVLIHGLGARNTYGPFQYFYGLPALLKNAGSQILIPSLTAWHSIQYRAQELRKQIEKQFPDQKVNLVGHSMGGLDARYLASRPDFYKKIASVTTIGTPHRGTLVGDIATDAVPGFAYAAIEKLLGYFGSSAGCLRQVTTRYAREIFSREAPDAPGVAYFSATSSIPEPSLRYSLPLFWLPHRILSRFEGDNDGFVPVESAKWGTHICTYRGDHYAQIGQILGRARGMNYHAFYRDIFGRLCKEGF